MPPKSSRASKAHKKHPSQPSTSSRVNTLKFDSTPASSSETPPMKKLKPLTAFAKPPAFDLTGLGSQSKEKARPDVKGKRKAKSQDIQRDLQDDRLWVDIYEPTTEAELAVHKKKVEDVRHWFVEAFEGGPSSKLRKYRRILALTGPAGTAKTATVRVLAREMGFEILEWKNTVGEHFSRNEFNDDSRGINTPVEHEALMDKFEVFLTRASTCQSIFAARSSVSVSSQSSRLSMQAAKRQVILLEDLPNILHADTQERFQAALYALVDSPTPGAPIVIIVSDTGTRGEANDERMDQGERWRKDVVDIRSVLPSGLLSGPYVTQIAFNPIAPTLLHKALQALLTTHFSGTSSQSTAAPCKEVLDIIIESANGDIRSAVMALQFACVVELPGASSSKKGKKKSGSGNARVVLEAVTRREQSLALFHLMGRVLYNKRKGDPSSSSATAKDIRREKELDSRINEPPPLPLFLKDHERRGSRVDVDMLYADSPIDSSLFSLYIHQNYTQFCDDIDHCEGISEWLSWVDSSGGETWNQANPHRFHLLTLGTLHSLPSPVPRRSQKFFKPEFYEVLKKERDAEDGVRDVSSWLMGLATGPGETAWRAGGWSKVEIATELGGVLKAREQLASGSTSSLTRRSSGGLPGTHRLFSNLVFTRSGASAGMQFGEGDDAGDLDVTSGDIDGDVLAGDATRVSGGWLESDDIEEF